MWLMLKIHRMSMGSCNIPDVIKRAVKTAGDTLDKATGKITGVQKVSVTRRDTMKIRPVAGITGNSLDLTLTKASHGRAMIIKVRRNAIHPMENTKTEFVLSQGNRLKDPGIGVKSLIN